MLQIRPNTNISHSLLLRYSLGLGSPHSELSLPPANDPDHRLAWISVHIVEQNGEKKTKCEDAVDLERLSNGLRCCPHPPTMNLFPGEAVFVGIWANAFCQIHCSNPTVELGILLVPLDIPKTNVGTGLAPISTKKVVGDRRDQERTVTSVKAFPVRGGPGAGARQTATTAFC